MQWKREPAPALRPFVRALWVLEVSDEDAGRREKVLPTGSVHLAIRLSGAPFSFDAEAPGVVTSESVIGGARSSAYVRTVTAGRSVGVQLEPGAAGLLFGIPAADLAERHTALEAIWGREAAALRERLAIVEGHESQLEVMEQFLAARLPRVHGLDPAIAHALERFRYAVPISQVVEEVGCSHRHFIGRFREAVGMSPKRFCRVRRLSRVLQLAARDRERPLADLALDAGYADQPHFNREFREIAGMTPGEYRAAAPRAAHHVPLAER